MLGLMASQEKSGVHHGYGKFSNAFKVFPTLLNFRLGSFSVCFCVYIFQSCQR